MTPGTVMHFPPRRTACRWRRLVPLFVGGGLPQNMADALRAHFADGCTVCEAEMESAMARELSAITGAVSEAPQPLPRWLYWAPAVLCTLGVGALWYLFS